MNVVEYQPSGAEIANAQQYMTPAGQGTALTPWSLDTDDLSFTVPTSTGLSVRFGFGRGDFASFPSPQGSLTGAGAATPTATVSGAAAVAGTPAASSVSPLVLVAIAAGVYFLFLRKKR